MPIGKVKWWKISWDNYQPYVRNKPDLFFHAKITNINEHMHEK
jgi:hypothetical protein